MRDSLISLSIGNRIPLCFLLPLLLLMGLLQSCLCGKSQPPSASTFTASKSTALEGTLDDLRSQAGVHYKKRGELLSASQSAYKSGDKKKAHDLSVAGKKEGALARALDEKAVAFVLEPQRWRASAVIDLHGLHVKESERVVEDFLDYHLKEKKEYAEMLIITGAGHHSKHHDHPVIRPAIEKLLTKRKVKWREVHKRGALLCDGKGKRKLDVKVGDGHFDKHNRNKNDNQKS